MIDVEIEKKIVLTLIISQTLIIHLNLDKELSLFLEVLGEKN